MLRASHRDGQGHKPHSIKELCRKWSEGHFTALWQYASDHARKPHFNPANRQTTESDRRVHYAISKVREGLLGKACKVLTSSGIAPNTSETKTDKRRGLTLRINTAKCELYSRSNLEGLPVDIKRFNEPNMEILGAPVGDIIFCAKFMAQKQARAARLLTQLTEVGSIDPQIALLLLRHCASFCKFVHLARSTPPPFISDGLALFDADVRRHFSDCVAIDASD